LIPSTPQPKRETIPMREGTLARRTGRVTNRNRLSAPAVHPLRWRMPACALADGTCSAEQDPSAPRAVS